ncbi:MAG: pentapeptide repeat-containing protein [Cyanobacteria bacterium]|nr:pentapeptide repeat-containing protein [Cyanobacteriota bacterium]
MVDTSAYELIQEDRPHDFNRWVETHEGIVDLTGVHLRGYDLRAFNLATANLTNAYMRAADIRGLDLTAANLEGVSIKDAKISGTLFPRNVSAQEIQLSWEHGTRIRTT